MDRIGLWLLKGVAYWIALTPFKLLYLKSDFYCFLVYHVYRYRRKVVRENLVNSFPEKSATEIKQIEKRFYHNFCDMFFEFCKTTRMKTEEFLRRFTITNPELIQDLYEKDRNVLLVMPHSGNWEWFWHCQKEISDHHYAAVYKAMKNKNADRFIHDMRRLDWVPEEQMIEDKNVIRALIERKKWRNLIFFLADQTPKGSESDYWTEFLHRETCWFRGMGKLSRKFDYSVVYTRIIREHRGYYRVSFETIAEDPSQMTEDEIVEQYVRHLERFLQEYPDNWLWSHRRWKHKRPTQAQ